MLLTLLVCGLSCGVLSSKVPDPADLHRRPTWSTPPQPPQQPKGSDLAPHNVVAASRCKADVAVGIEPLCLTKKVMLLHFSKCSGTTICNLARQAGCETWKSGVNCGGRLQQLPTYRNPYPNVH